MAGNPTLTTLTTQASRLPKTLLLRYAFDWLSIVLLVGLAIGFHNIEAPSLRHAFSLQDSTLSYPLTSDLISNPVLYTISIICPAVLLILLCLLPTLTFLTTTFTTTLTTTTTTPKQTRTTLPHRLHTLHHLLLGLALSTLTAITLTNLLKPLTGKPRPHLLAACNPDLTPSSISQHQIGGLGTPDTVLTSATPILVTYHICQNTDASQLRNAFASWPSGHASTSFAGLLYLSLVFCAMTNIRLLSARQPLWGSGNQEAGDRAQGGTPAWRQTATATPPPPPVWLLIIAFVPVGVAMFVSVSRWFDYRHHGFDVISGAVIGVLCAWVNFRLYWCPLSSLSSSGGREGGRSGGAGEFDRHEEDAVGDQNGDIALQGGSGKRDVECQPRRPPEGGVWGAREGGEDATPTL